MVCGDGVGWGGMGCGGVCSGMGCGVWWYGCGVVVLWGRVVFGGCGGVSVVWVMFVCGLYVVSDQ